MNAVPCSAPFLRRMLGRTLTELELTLEVACEVCAHCGSVNLFPGFSRMLAFTVGSAGRPFCVRVSLFQPSPPRDTAYRSPAWRLFVRLDG